MTVGVILIYVWQKGGSSGGGALLWGNQGGSSTRMSKGNIRLFRNSGDERGKGEGEREKKGGTNTL